MSEYTLDLDIVILLLGTPLSIDIDRKRWLVWEAKKTQI